MSDRLPDGLIETINNFIEKKDGVQRTEKEFSEKFQELMSEITVLRNIDKRLNSLYNLSEVYPKSYTLQEVEDFIVNSQEKCISRIENIIK